MHLTHRPRRVRSDAFNRELIAENTLGIKDLIYPVFVCEGSNQQQPIASMPGIYRWSVDTLINHLKPLVDKGLLAVAIFPVIDNELKDAQASEALNPNGLTPRTLQTLSETFPELGLIADIALDPYTDHGLDGLIDSTGYVVNDESVEVLVQQAVMLAKAGAGIVAPSDMMDGRVGAIRQALEENRLVNTRILSYTAKYASAFYGPFRDAVGSAKALGKSNKLGFQLNPANSREAVQEAELDIAEGADMLMVKPALPYLDIVKQLRQQTSLPVFGYQVSGEYAMIMGAIQNGWLGKEAIHETLLSIKRAGADAILSYFAAEVIEQLQGL